MSKFLLFSDIPHDRDFDLAIDIKRALQVDVKQCPWSREEIAGRLSLAMQRPVTVAQINAWTAATKPHRFPLDMLAAWVVVTGSRRLLDVVIPAAGFAVADEREQQLAAYARTLLQRDEVTVREARQREELVKSRRDVCK